MRLLLDTHVALWAIAGSPQLSIKARDLILDAANEVHVSVATLWEIAIKHALKKKGPSAMTISSERAHGFFERAGYALLPIAPAHVHGLSALAPLHADPFDRLLVAQAQTEPMHLLTHDKRIAAYGDLVIVV